MKKQFLKRLMLICAFVLALDLFLQYQLYLHHKNNQIVEVSSQLSEIRAQLENRITANLLLAKGIANFFAIETDVSQETFRKLAQKTVNGHHLVKNIEVAQDYVIRYVYPLAGNEQALGFNYRANPEQWEQVRRVGETGQLVVVGPQQLVQGGYGLIERVPILKEKNGKEQFWGLASAVIDLDQLFTETGLSRSKLDLAIREVGGTNDGGVFWGNPGLFAAEESSVTTTLSFPGGEWQLAGQLEGGWLTLTAPPLAYLIHLLLLLFALVLGYLTYHSTRESYLTVQARQSLDEAQAIAHLGSWRIRLKDREVWWSSENYRIFGQNPGTFTPTYEKYLDLVHPEDRQMVIDGLELLQNRGETYALDHRIIHADGSVRHVQARGQVHYGEDRTPLFIHGTLLDITERKLTDQALQASEEMNRAIVEASLDALVTVNSQDEIIFWSPTSERMFGWTREEALGKKLHRLIVPEKFQDRAERGQRLFVKTGKGPVINKVLEFTAVRKDGSCFPVDISVSGFRLNGAYYAHGSLRDATERKEAEFTLRQLATTDALTGISNRRHFMELAELEMKRSQRYNSPFSIILLDADHFKQVNDTYGHDVGDIVLKHIARTTATILREPDIFGRFGGEEFTIALPQTDIKGAEQLAERLRLLIENNTILPAGGQRIAVTISLGIAETTAATQDLEELLKQADIALYRAKNKGRNRVAMFS